MKENAQFRILSSLQREPTGMQLMWWSCNVVSIVLRILLTINFFFQAFLQFHQFFFSGIFAIFYILHFSIMCPLKFKTQLCWLRFSLPSNIIIIMATANEPSKNRNKQKEGNLPITTDKHDLLTQLTWSDVSWEVC